MPLEPWTSNAAGLRAVCAGSMTSPGESLGMMTCGITPTPTSCFLDLWHPPTGDTEP